MNMLIQTLHQASANPYSWAIAGLIAMVTLFSVYKWYACPYLCRTKAISPEESHQQLNRSFAAGPRFVVVMLGGIAAMLVGLSLVSREVYPLLALLLIAVGVFAVHLEPALLRLQDSALRVISAQCQGPEAIAAAEDRLRYAHISLVGANFTLLGAVVLVLLAF